MKQEMVLVIYITVGGGMVGLIVWHVAMILMRTANWNRSGVRIKKIKSPEALEYHNKAIYSDFEYFYKVTLAILGGIAYVATREKPLLADVNSILLLAAAGIQLISGIIFPLFIIIHQKSKIERWDRRFTIKEIAFWQECWMVAAMFAVSAGIAFGAVPYLLKFMPYLKCTC